MKRILQHLQNWSPGRSAGGRQPRAQEDERPPENEEEEVTKGQKEAQPGDRGCCCLPQFPLGPLFCLRQERSCVIPDQAIPDELCMKTV